MNTCGVFCRLMEETKEVMLRHTYPGMEFLVIIGETVFKSAFPSSILLYCFWSSVGFGFVVVFFGCSVLFA